MIASRVAPTTTNLTNAAEGAAVSDSAHHGGGGVVSRIDVFARTLFLENKSQHTDTRLLGELLLV